uniref:VWFA domain-containing protein n=1 Tax=Chelonoidis abingdonii TaxID=106734 RepID=A0A8C0GCK1_CHEAB
MGHPLSPPLFSPRRLIVGAPLQIGDVNETGKVYKCDPGSRRCEEIPIQSRVLCSEGHLLTPCLLVPQACGPTLHRACGENMYVNGYCFLLDQNLRQLQHIPDTQPECPKHVTDIVLLIDGSGSITPVDFGKMKTFLSEIMKRFHSTDTQFALMQYSNKFELHFDFMEYRRSRDPDRLVQGVEQLHGTTHTASAIRKVMRELFTSGRGARDEATKVLIVITDGEKYKDPLSYSDAVPEAERAGIIRYAIGVGQAFSSDTAQQELHVIASEPTNEHIFRVDSFDALQGIQSQLQEKIFAIEGTQSQSSSSFQLEMSQEGFSSLLSPDGPVLGAVGAYDWSGGIYLYESSGKPSFINVSRTSTDMNDAYLVVWLFSISPSSYVVGAPRYQHTGKVILFSQDTKGGKWTPRSEQSGEQIGSYFGGTLCALDLDRDGNTDLVLIGAPMYYTALNGGRVYICLINWLTLQGQTGQAFGHFGASMSEIGDISGDGQMDVAIGAPMENDNRGALYIFHGEKGDLIPFVSLSLSLVSTPPVGDSISSTIQYSLALDPRRTKIRAAFDSTSPVLSRELHLGIETRCETYRIMLPVSMGWGGPTSFFSHCVCPSNPALAPKSSREQTSLWVPSSPPFPSVNRHVSLSPQLCPEDTLTPITLRLNYTLTGEPIAATSRLRPILSEDSAPVSLPFQKDCGTDGRCDDQLEISFSFSGLSTLVVGVTPELNTTVSIQNRGENSYSTTVRFFYPGALSYRRVLLLQVPQCTPGMRGRLCRWCRAAGNEQGFPRPGLSPPPRVFQAVFIATFDVSSEADLGDRLQIMANARLERGLGIRAPGFSSCSALWRVCFFQVKNLRQRSVPILVTFQFPVELSGVRVWDVSEVVPSKVPCTSEAETPGSKDFVKQMSKRPLLNCSVATCKKIRCRIASLEMQQPLEFMINGNVSFQWVSQTQQQKVSLVSEAQIEYEEEKYTQKEGFVQRQVQTVVERSEVYNYLPIIVGSSVGGLGLLALITAALYKLGFFKRQYKQRLEDGVEGEGPGPTQSTTTGNLPASDAPKQ